MHWSDCGRFIKMYTELNTKYLHIAATLFVPNLARPKLNQSPSPHRTEASRFPSLQRRAASTTVEEAHWLFDSGGTSWRASFTAFARWLPSRVLGFLICGNGMISTSQGCNEEQRSYQMESKQQNVLSVMRNPGVTAYSPLLSLPGIQSSTKSWNVFSSKYFICIFSSTFYGHELITLYLDYCKNG